MSIMAQKFSLTALIICILQMVHISAAQNATDQSVFISNGGNVAFGINVPNGSTADIYFSLQGRTSNTWTAVGLGVDEMKGALVLMIYQNVDGTNITISPRLASNTVEPDYSSSIEVEALAGTGVDAAAGTLIFNGRCSNCRSWSGGSLDVASTAQNFIFAVGPNGTLRSDDVTESVQYHQEYGTFTMNLVQAAGIPKVPSLAVATGSQAVKDYKDQSDVVIPIHGIVVLVSFLGLFPLAAIIIEVCGMPRLYIVTQVLSALVVLVGIALGIYDSTYYNKTKSMSTPHQVIGFIVLAFIVINALLGCIYFPRYRRSKASGVETSRTLHIGVVGLGWLTILLGCINGFLGFPLASNSDNDKILGGVFAAVIVVLTFILTLNYFCRRRRGSGRGDRDGNAANGRTK